MLVVLVSVVVVAWSLAFEVLRASFLVFSQVICVVGWVCWRLFVDGLFFERIVALKAGLLWS